MMMTWMAKCNQLTSLPFKGLILCPRCSLEDQVMQAKTTEARPRPRASIHAVNCKSPCAANNYSRQAND